MKSITTLAPVLALLLSTSCRKADSTPPASLLDVRDSAGIRFTNASAPSLAPQREWRLGEAATSTIGGDGTGGHELFRVVAAARLRDGGIVVANAGSFQIRFYDQRGTLVRSTGRSGEGPGEFTDITHMVRTVHDTIVVHDHALRRLTVYDARGNLTRVERVTLPGGGMDMLAVDSVGSVVGSLPDMAQYTSTSPVPQLDRLLYRAHTDGRIDTLGRFLGYVRGETNDESTSYYNPWGGLRACGGRIVFWRTDVYALRVLDADGVLRQIVRRTFTPVRITDEFFDEFRKERLREMFGSSGEGNGPMPPWFAALNRKRVANATHPEFFPPIVDVRCDADANYWVKESPAVWTKGIARWSVFDPSGRWVTQITLPKNSNVMEIGSGYILLHMTDDDGIEEVRLYDLIKPGLSAAHQ